MPGLLGDHPIFLFERALPGISGHADAAHPPITDRPTGVIHRSAEADDLSSPSGLDRGRRMRRPAESTGVIVNRELENTAKARSAGLARAAAAGAAALIMGGLLVGCETSSADQESSPSQSASSTSSEAASSTPSPTTPPTRVSNPDHDTLDPRGPLPGSTKWEQMMENDQ
jgi:hypothetical protein